MIRKPLSVWCAAALLAGPLPVLAQGSVDFDQGIDARQALGSVQSPSPEAPVAAPQPQAAGASEPSRAPAAWTIMVFVNGKNNLEPFAFANVNQMEMVGSTPNVNIVVEMGVLNAWRGSRRYLIKKDDDPNAITSPVVQSFPKVDMGDWRHLVDFGTWAKKNYPAQRYMLIVWNHGDGWRLRSGMSIQGISYDDETGHHISTPELGQALAAIGGVDVYGSDACLMQMAEVSYEIKGNAGTIVGSEEVEPGDGYTYDTLLRPIADNPALAAEDVGRVAVKSYRDHYVGSRSQVTQSALRSSALGGLIPLLDDWTAEVMAAGETRLVKDAMDSVQKFDITDNVDLYDFVRLVSAGTANASVRAQGLRVMDFIQNQLVISNGVLGDNYANAEGLAIYLPTGGVSASYDGLAWAKGSRWEDFAKWASNAYSRNAAPDAGRPLAGASSL